MFLIMPLFYFFSVAYVGSTTACPLQAPSAAVIIVSTTLSFCLELTLAKAVAVAAKRALLVHVMCSFLAGEEHSIAGGRAYHVREVARAGHLFVRGL
jgi:hypothetical protein